MKMRGRERGCYAGERQMNNAGEEYGMCRTLTGDVGCSFAGDEDGGRFKESDAAENEQREDVDGEPFILFIANIK
jgi:hypothetical protein